jgi:hypothetical protein
VYNVVSQCCVIPGVLHEGTATRYARRRERAGGLVTEWQRGEEREGVVIRVLKWMENIYMMMLRTINGANHARPKMVR